MDGMGRPENSLLFERFPILAVADWRRQMAELFAAARRKGDCEVAWREWREGRDALIRDHTASPLVESERARALPLPFFDYDPAYRFTVDLVAVDGSEEAWEIGADGTLRLQAVARTSGLAAALGAELTLYWLLGYGGGLFMPFSDATSARQTYGGGRYLLDSIKSADLGFREGRLLLDFNFAYNPSCAYSPDWTCPLAPPENKLTRPVMAGEKAPRASGSSGISHAAL
ncbi:DUF1684 domain-containing protein [Limibacillus sp. MBR-115]|jgi:uncharacterized protein (DUF1684 family)|uniref:DUF1684 domain-containing protein n=1 Tax=Limibacillus sp. MBR-115 TaxID=3156465 RepID=UPI0033960D32